jgi:hypothetical protein
MMIRAWGQVQFPADRSLWLHEFTQLPASIDGGNTHSASAASWKRVVPSVLLSSKNEPDPDCAALKKKRLLAAPHWRYFAAQQIDNIPIQHEPELAEHEQRWVANRALYLTDVSSINVSVKGKLLL